MALNRGATQGQTGQTRQRQQVSEQLGQYQQRSNGGTAFHTPILARERQSNEPLTLIAFGDIPGNSPSYLCVDDAGASTWLSLGDVQITDARVLPLTAERQGRILDQMNQQQQQVVNG